MPALSLGEGEVAMSRAATVHFTTDLGASISVETTLDKVLEALRYFGAKG